jgi:hypothetical protein
MDNIKGNAALNIGYSCKQRELVNQYTRTPPCKIRTSHVFSIQCVSYREGCQQVKGWRAIWSEASGTTDPNAPYGERAFLSTPPCKIYIAFI